MNEFYVKVVQQHLRKLFDEREQYRVAAALSKNNSAAYRLMADFYDALIVTAQQHIADHTGKEQDANKET